ncbi:methyltransferase family protein [Engelhardtia mirabilis]|uniref:methanethiol S-methyltransferase n=1 Tax=Engelhardtia mirabilis TaxID=2528011 RepID=A0A518BIP0_9BACT|nr:hypothetical protein Pla133_19170 [Planctomycetes bacterium Pla133]QDV01167.1 hypothetical protein Pla86_19160 [Planctomycetes bacterium Pla86]
MIARIATLAYGLTAYTLFFGTFLYLIAFVVGLPQVPFTLDGAPVTSTGLALAIDVALVALFGIQHAIMARPAFKRRWTKLVPASIERSTFMVATCVCLALIFTQWRALPGTVWSVENQALAIGLWSLNGLGWGMVLLSTFLIDHFDLFGLRQTWLAFRGRQYTAPRYVERSLYRVVRHPLMLGMLIAFWATPVMSVSHLMFSLTFTGYVLIGTRIEERTLVELHGEDYRDYARRVPGLVPFAKPRGARSVQPAA